MHPGIPDVLSQLQGAVQQVGLCLVSSQATIREELLQEMGAAGPRLSFTPA